MGDENHDTQNVFCSVVSFARCRGGASNGPHRGSAEQRQPIEIEFRKVGFESAAKHLEQRVYKRSERLAKRAERKPIVVVKKGQQQSARNVLLTTEQHFDE
jgi:hypothetical protein